MRCKKNKINKSWAPRKRNWGKSKKIGYLECKGENAVNKIEYFKMINGCERSSLGLPDLYQDYYCQEVVYENSPSDHET